MLVYRSLFPDPQFTSTQIGNQPTEEITIFLKSAIHFCLSLCAKVYELRVLALRQSNREDLNNHQRSPRRFMGFTTACGYPFNSAYLWKRDRLLLLVIRTSGLLTHIFKAVCREKSWGWVWWANVSILLTHSTRSWPWKNAFTSTEQLEDCTFSLWH